MAGSVWVHERHIWNGSYGGCGIAGLLSVASLVQLTVLIARVYLLFTQKLAHSQPFVNWLGLYQIRVTNLVLSKFSYCMCIGEPTHSLKTVSGLTIVTKIILCTTLVSHMAVLSDVGSI